METNVKVIIPELFLDKSSIGDFLEPNDIPETCEIWSPDDESNKIEKSCSYQFSYLKDFGVRRIDYITIKDICSDNNLCELQKPLSIQFKIRNSFTNDLDLSINANI